MTAEYVFWIAVLVMAGCNLYFLPRITCDRIAMQWGLNGRPTWYAPKAVGLWGMVALALAVRLLIWAASTYIPEKVHGVEIGLSIGSVILLAGYLMTLVAALKAN
jgi:hypothetical protein